MRRLLSDLSERLSGTPIATVTLKEFAAQWLDRKRVEIGGISFLAYKSAVNEFVEQTPAKANVGLQYLTVADIASFRDRAAAKASGKTANNKIKIVRTLLQSAWRDGYIPDNPAAKVTTLKVEDSIRRPFTVEELKRLLSVATGEWRGIILVGLYTGQRLKDVASLRWTSVDLSRREISLTTSKTKRRQIIPMAKALEAYFDDLPAPDDARAVVFPNAFSLLGQSGSTSRLSGQFFDLLVTANLAVARLSKDKSSGVGRSGPRARSEITFHSLRHTATSLLKNAGVSESVVMDIIGHDSKEVSRNYTHVSEQSKRDAFDLFPDVSS